MIPYVEDQQTTPRRHEIGRRNIEYRPEIGRRNLDYLVIASDSEDEDYIPPAMMRRFEISPLMTRSINQAPLPITRAPLNIEIQSPNGPTIITDRDQIQRLLLSQVVDKHFDKLMQDKPQR